MTESMLDTNGALQVPSWLAGAAVVGHFSTECTSLIALGVVNGNVFSPCNISAETG
jgi:hypothetical protein